ncbi:MAG: HlyD family type I secretion periplasmic adaptor subunit [Permianibacter sp.]
MNPLKSDAPEYAFLPAAAEIEESPPNPLARKVLWLLCGLFFLAVLWACLGEVDIVAVAPGKVVVSDRTKVIQPTELGVVRAIHVRDGSLVKAGDVLVELDATSAEADASRVKGEQDAAAREVNRYKSFLAYLDGAERQLPSTLGAVDRQFVSGLIDEYQQKRAALTQSEISKRAEREALVQTEFRLEQTLPIISQRTESLRELAEKKLVAEHQWLEQEERLITAKQDLEVARAQRAAVEAEVEQILAQLKGLKAEYRKLALERVSEAEQRRDSLLQENIKANQRSAYQLLRAPVAGVVQELAVHTIGGVVTPAEKLLVIVPQDGGIEVEALVLNKDIGFVEDGQTVSVKVDSFPFTRYGTLPGKIVSISNDAIQHEQLGLVFSARVALEKHSILAGNKQIPLGSGMTTVTEIHTGKRTLMEYLLSPVLGRMDEAARER